MSGSGSAELLSLRKAALRLRIAQRRAQIQAELAQVAEPLHRADAWLSRLRRLRFLWPVLQALWLGARGGATGAVRSRFAGWRKLARWAPVVWKVVRAARERCPTYADHAE